MEIVFLRRGNRAQKKGDRRPARSPVPCLLSPVSWVCILALGLGVVGDAAAEVKKLVLGGEEYPWAETGKITAFDLVSGALRSREYRPYKNVLQMLDRRRGEDVIWFPYHSGRDRGPDYDFVPGEDPRAWVPLDSPAFLDGSPTEGDIALNAAARYVNHTRLFDVGVPIRVNRFVFYPLQEGTVPPDKQYAGAPYRETYIRAYQVSAGRREPPRSMPATESLEIILRETLNNFESIVEVMFPLQIFRFFKLRNLVDAGYTLAEIELYGEGFAPEAWFTSEIVDLNAPVNFGRIFWDFGKYRWRREWTWTGSEESGEGIGASELDLRRRVVPELWEETLIDPEPVIWEDAPVSLSVEVRAGKDDSPLIYHEITEIGERPVTKEEYLKLRERPWAVDVFNPLIPGMRGSIIYDDEHWSPWSPIPASGVEATVPDGRRYIQFRVKVFSEDPWAFGQMDSLWIEYAAPLAQEVAGEVVVQDEPSPPGGVATVEAGEETTFLYALRATFDGTGGFDAVRIVTPTVPAFEGLWMGKPLRKVEPDSVALGEGTLEVYLPRRVSRNDDPVQVALRTAVLAYGTQFYGEVWDTERADLLPQGIAPGDAVAEITTNQLQVFVAKASLEVLTGVAIQPEVITPNGDGSNDGATITYTLSLVSGGAEVEVGVYDLAGSKVWGQREKTKGSVYKEQTKWEGRDEEGNLVQPGVYMCRVLVNTDGGEFQKALPITVIY